jgi:hypothetical protein
LICRKKVNVRAEHKANVLSSFLLLEKKASPTLLGMIGRGF